MARRTLNTGGWWIRYMREHHTQRKHRTIRVLGHKHIAQPVEIAYFPSVTAMNDFWPVYGIKLGPYSTLDAALDEAQDHAFFPVFVRTGS